MDTKATWDEWFENERQKLIGSPRRRAKRTYLHFDSRISRLDKKQTEITLDPGRVAKHSFYPFIRIDTREKRFRRAGDGTRRRIKSTKHRPIDYASHNDSLIFSWYAHLLSIPYEEELMKRNISENVIAYRSIRAPVKKTGKSNADFAKDALGFIRQKTPCDILTIDVSKFFQEINHSLLKKQWAKLLKTTVLPNDHFQVFTNVTRFRFVRMGRIRGLVRVATKRRLPRICTPSTYRAEIISKGLQELGGKAGKGIPQGAPISCVLANVYMIDFDAVLADETRKLGGFYQRYSDDILIVVPPGHLGEMYELIVTEMSKLSLKIKDEKTEKIATISNGEEIRFVDLETGKGSRFRYLGIESDGSSTQIRHGSLARFQRKLNRKTRKAVLNASIKGNSGAPKKYLFTKFGKQKNNFLSYAKRASETLEAPEIQHQVSAKREAGRVKKKIRNLSRRFGGFKNS